MIAAAPGGSEGVRGAAARRWPSTVASARSRSAAIGSAVHRPATGRGASATERAALSATERAALSAIALVLLLGGFAATAWNAGRSPIDAAAPAALALRDERANAAASGLPVVLIDLNRADASELAALPRIGPALAARIVADRAANGPFRSVDELVRVRGIGPVTVELVRPLARAATPPTASGRTEDERSELRRNGG
ncbi:MAG TPA: helix-hairpin-helix domain-containing protein [Phycisphaerales bacterium]|nr:helix-hairpin-helix domain-containing protein [Phycisphaerales bacterium]HMP36958.1 helix-hairpin-helix domain-containing protein [Phycisphaerales bacterium]